MGVGLAPGGGSGVLGLGPRQNTFGDGTTTDRATAEGLRDTYAGANANWLARYNANLSFWIRLVWSGGSVEQRRNGAGDDWEDVTNVIRGNAGPEGPEGPPGPAPDASNVDPIIAAYDGAIPALDIAESQVPSEIARAADVPGDADIDARIAAPARANSPSGTFEDARIPATIARDTEITTQITSQVKEFARTGERGVRAADMDSESAADNQVPTADGSGGVAWENQQDPPAMVPSGTRYAAIIADNANPTEAEWLAGNTSLTDHINLPSQDGQGYHGFAIPATQDDLTTMQQAAGVFNERGQFAPAQNENAVLQDIGGVSCKTYIRETISGQRVAEQEWILQPGPPA